ncbi:MAG: sigma-70 family RNA polymerase sigma factor [Oscillospiraceae bacterium]|nr:sigma-70 family RNA polymerase sigma factor [Oscillospiraceae bacterium]
MSKDGGKSVSRGGQYELDTYFNNVYKETLSSISRYVVSKCGNVLDVEDILQNIYTRFFRRIVKKGYGDIDNAEAFLVNIAKFECKNYFGAMKKRSVTSSFSDFSDEQMVEIEAEMSRSSKHLEDVVCNEMLARQIFEDIASQDAVTGKIFYLHFVCDKKLEEIAGELGLSLSSVKNRLYRTIERQRKKYTI